MSRRNFSWIRCLRYGIPILLTVLWIAFIFGNSLQNGVESGNQSKQVQEWVNTVLQGVGISQGMSESLIRRLGHFSEFAVLALLYIGDLIAFRLVGFSRSPLRSLSIALTAVPVCFLFGCIDEIIQKFSAGRASEFGDVLTDTVGGAVATLLFCAAFFSARFFCQRKFQKKQEKGRID